MKVIGFTAKVGGGKDTAGLLITKALEEKGYRVTKISFAKCLKDICTMMFGWDRERLEHDFAYKEGNTLDDGSPDPACEMLGKTRRVVMQELGTEAMRNGLHYDVWIIALKLAIMRGDYDDYDYGLLTDCRFINELQFVRDLDGTLIRLERLGEQSTLTDQTQHLSELEWEQWTDWDASVVNYIDPNLPDEMNLMALRNKLEDAINYEQITDRNATVDMFDPYREDLGEEMSDPHWDDGAVGGSSLDYGYKGTF
jgi:hypothetical protein